MTKARDLANFATAGAAVSATELGFVDGVTSAIQTQMDAKAPSSTAVTLTGTQTLTNKTLTSPVLTTPTISTVDAKGDLLAGTADNTIDRLPVGTNNQTLVADSTASTGLKWAANSQGMTLLSTTSLTGATTTISSIDQTYTNLYMLISGVTNASANGDFRIAPNTTTNASSGQVNDGGQNTFTLKVADFMFITFGTSANNKITFNNANNGFAVTIDNYASATTFKPYSVSGGFHVTNAGGVGSALVGGSFNSNTAITSLVFSNSGGNLSTGTVLLYGVK